MVGCVYKVISKVLTNRMKMVMDKIIDNSQLAFIEGIGLLDSIIVAKEVVKECSRKKKKVMIIKIDYEKAYDSVR